MKKELLSEKEPPIMKNTAIGKGTVKVLVA